MKRILKGVFGVFKFKKPIESREAFEMQLFDKISLLASSSLQKQIPISDTHPLLHVASKLKEIIQDSPPEKVFNNIDTLISSKINESSSSMHSILTMPQSSITSLTETNTSSESTLYKQQLFLRLTLYKDYLRRLRIDVDSNEIKASDLNSDILIRINDSFLLGNSSERIAEHLRLYKDNIQQFQFQTSMYHLLEPEVHACVSALQALGMTPIDSYSHITTTTTATTPRVVAGASSVVSSSLSSISSTSTSTSGTSTSGASTSGTSKATVLKSLDPEDELKQMKKIVKRFVKYSKYYLLDTVDLNTKCRSIYSWTDPLNKEGFKALPDEFTYPVDTILKSRVLYFPEGSTVSHDLFNGFIASTRILYEEEKETRRNIRYSIVFIIGTCLLDWYICIM